ncbi:Ca2+-transporting ATPase [Formivibrio citricus]|uniref:Ca2+-transporting ATPase n=1 Tax=Formivibrio citricus TaxID=83765 RepID=A0A1I4VZM5_9NEIS|nr:cation-translocating P-type ATPase [Formivibrio citricus]SFN06605.1 Ca2+-transporting ATPase [Formivibrio citricus]
MNAEFPSGLSAAEAAARRAAEGPNELGTEQKRTLQAIAVEVAREPMFLLLLGAGAIYAAMGDIHEAMILLGFVFVIMAVTILQERRTENTLEALRDLSSPRALVIRDGTPQRISGREVVRDDIVILTEGDRVPADGEVLQAHELATDESMLTGESVAVAKFAGDGAMFAGTMVVRGQGLMRVTAVGGKTELGRIGKSLKDIAIESSPLHDEVGLLTRRLAMIGVGLCLMLSSLYWILRGGWLEGLLAGITLAMGILPQEFPVIMIVFLAMGARRIAQQRVLTRRLNAIETLGETTVLCVDKTGTLTQNRMTVTTLSVGGKCLDAHALPGDNLPEEYHELLEYAVLASEIDPHDPMEQAFHRFARNYLANTEHLHPDWALAREYELSPALLAMSHLWQDHNGQHDVVAAKGAVEAIADLCHLEGSELEEVMQQAEDLAKRGLRVLGIARAEHSANASWPAIQHDFDFRLVGLIGLADPLRDEVPAAIAECRRAGIRVVMITGDHPRTARAIAAAAGIDGDEVLTGAELAGMTTSELARRIAGVNVFARVTPQQKLAIVEALKANGEIVAMTGDGVNDAPALKSAHIGIAMGKRGTDVAREAASLVLLEDDFSAIVSAIRLGRRIFANLRQALIYTLAVHVPIIGLSILPLLLGLPLVLAPIHIAFLELVIDPACSVVFEAEKGSDKLMEQPPRSPAERLVSSRQLVTSLVLGLLTSAVTAGIYSWLISHGKAAEEARALAFVVLVAANTALIFACRAREPGWHKLFDGLARTSILVIAATLTGLAIVTLVPSICAAFAFRPPPLQEWLQAFLIGIGMMALFVIAQNLLQKKGEGTMSFPGNTK